ncbi:BatD family protein [Flavobacterium sp. 316]|uniref:BatD family protein n=1 Tax=Flavobacterium sp. 316 TaxID=1603293 RepID=UPI001F19D714|nr:BatD family protein [Flavobacterium sp. 316]
MKKIGKMKNLFVIIVLFIQTMLLSQEVKFEASSHKTSYALNEKIRIIFSINNEGDNFVPPSFENFRAQGPIINKGGETSIVITNGQAVTRRVIQTQIIYYLTPLNQGKFTIAPASIEYEGKIFKSNPITFTITEAREVPKDPNSPDYIAGEGIHLVSEVSKSNPYINEPVTIVYKLYFDPNFRLRNFEERESPKYKGFWSQNIEVKDLQPELVTYNGQQYGMIVLKRAVLYPLEQGDKEIEPLTISLEVNVPKREQIGSFVRSIYVPTTKNVSTGVKKIKVKGFPEEGKPLSFTGAVGKFDFSVKPSKEELKSGESLNLEISVSGNGNLKLFNLPKPEFPSVFEVFDPEHKEQVNVPLSGMNGSISDNYTIIPQFKGKYTIKPIEFSYFDLKTNSYKTVTSEEVTINVLDNPNFTSTQNNPTDTGKQKVVKSVNFQFIKLKSEFAEVSKKDFLGTKLFYALLFAPFLIVPIIILVRKKKEAIDADEFGNKIRRNNRLAKKYLSEAKKQKGNKVPFYMAMEKALHNFLKAKLHIETSEMSKENIQELLENKAASNETISQFIALMNDCEFARYAPSSNVTMQQDFEKAVLVISDLEKQLS